MRMRNSIGMWMGCGLVLAGLCGCNGDAQREAKREQDRTAMELADAQRQHDTDQAQIDQLKTQLDAANKDDQANKASLDDTNAKLQKAIDDLSAAQTNQANAHDAATKKLVDENSTLRKKFLDLQNEAMQETDENVKLTQEITQLREQLANQTAAPSSTTGQPATAPAPAK